MVGAVDTFGSGQREACVVDLLASAFPSPMGLSGHHPQVAERSRIASTRPGFDISRCLAGNANVAPKQFLAAQGKDNPWGWSRSRARQPLASIMTPIGCAPSSKRSA